MYTRALSFPHKFLEPEALAENIRRPSGTKRKNWNEFININIGSYSIMATVKRYSIFCQKCNHKFPVFAMVPHTVDVNTWMKDKADNHDCKAYADQMAKERAPRPVNPLKASKKGA